MRLIDADKLEYEILHTDFEIVKHECKDYESYVNGANCFRSKAKNLINKAPTVQVMGEWISVEERLPEIPKDSECITVLGYNGEIHDYIIDSENRWWDDDGWSTPRGFGITHWMTLPQPPQMKGE